MSTQCSTNLVGATIDADRMSDIVASTAHGKETATQRRAAFGR
jgi:hypothetical protein